MKRHLYLKKITSLFKGTNRAVALLGPRQCGKSTLAKQYASNVKQVHFFDLEDPTDLARLSNPKLALSSLEGLVVIDEIQRSPELFPVLRVLLDDKKSKTQFLILGSASRELIKQSSETLAGRMSYLEMSPFSYTEVVDWEKLWIRGGYPRSFLAKSFQESVQWRNDYISTFLERDIPQLGFNIPSTQMRRFWMMLTHYHGQTWNSSEIAASMGVSDQTTRRYLDILSGTFMVRQLLPGFSNINKRIVKAPKIYLRDSGLFHSLLGLKKTKDLLLHPKLGASWEGFALESAINKLGLSSEECFYFSVHNQFEIDLFLPARTKPIGIEIKYNEAPKLTRSMTNALDTLQLDKLYIIYPGDKDYKLSSKIHVLPFKNFDQFLK